MYSANTNQFGDQYLFLSTPNPVPFTVTLTDGAGNVFATPTISQGNPVEVPYGNGQVIPTDLIVPTDSVGVVLIESGVIATAQDSFYCNLRITQVNQAGSITAKGRSALGTTFYAGSMPQPLYQAGIRNFVASIMATEDNTTIQVTGYDPGVIFDCGTGAITDDTLDIILNSGECYVITGNTTTLANCQGFVGAKIISNKNIVLTNGNYLGTIFSNGEQDIGLDQSVPVDKLGTEYVLVRGNGNNNSELPLAIATESNTQIFVNGSATPITTLVNPGDFFLIPESNYLGTLHENMYVTGSKNFYMYQPLAGSTSSATGGLNFIPPTSCFLPNTVDLIPNVDTIGTSSFIGAVTVFTSVGSTLLINGVAPSAASGPETVTGTGGIWETYNISGLSGDISVTSTGPTAVGYFGANGASGYAGFYSGFGEAPTLTIDPANAVLSLLDSGYCLNAPLIPTLTVNSADGVYQWFHDNTVIPSATSTTLNPSNVGEYYVEVTVASCVDNSNTINLVDCTILLPTDLVDFSVNCNEDNTPVATWSTFSEINSSSFIIQASEKNNGEFDWKEVATTEATGYSSSLLDYEQILQPSNYAFFRLKQVEASGYFHYSDIVSAECENFEFNVYPNPGSTELHIEANNKREKVEILSPLGLVKYSEIVDFSKNQTLHLNISDFTDGVYVIRIGENVSKFIVKAN